jgi:hypothetical protein
MIYIFYATSITNSLDLPISLRQQRRLQGALQIRPPSLQHQAKNGQIVTSYHPPVFNKAAIIQKLAINQIAVQLVQVTQQ